MSVTLETVATEEPIEEPQQVQEQAQEQVPDQVQYQVPEQEQPDPTPQPKRRGRPKKQDEPNEPKAPKQGSTDIKANVKLRRRANQPGRHGNDDIELLVATKTSPTERTQKHVGTTGGPLVDNMF